MIINSEIANLANTPGIEADTAANKPLATSVAIGTIYIETDTGNISRSNGTTWVTVGGGSGSTPGIDDVLSVNQLFSGNQTIDLDNYQLEIKNLIGQNVITFDKNNITTFGQSNNNIVIDGANNSCKFYFQDSGFANLISITQANKYVKLGDFVTGATGVNLQLDSTNRVFYIQDQNVTDGIYIDFFNSDYKLGKLDPATEQMIFFDITNQQTSTFFNGNIQGINLDFSSTNYQFGATDGSVLTDIYFNINQNNESGYFIYNGNDNGLKLDFKSGQRYYALGDYQGTFDLTSLILNDATQTATLKATAETVINTAKLNFPDPNIETTSSSGTSGNHLKVTVNGVDYVIELKNP